MDWSYVQEIIPRFVQAALVTLRLSAWGVSLSLLLGLAVALVTSYRVRPFDSLARAYIELSRNTPLLIQLFFLYYGLPKIGIHWDGFTCGVIALTFLGGSYMAEALRAGLQAVPRGQVESARAIGLKRAQVLWHVVLPQALAIALPALTANALFLVKETSVVSIIALPDLVFKAKEQIGSYYQTSEALLLLVVFYLVILLPVSLGAGFLERRLRRATFGD